MRRKKLYILAILALLFLTSMSIFVYMQNQAGSGISEKAKASEITQSQLQILENQVNEQQANSQNPGGNDTVNQPADQDSTSANNDSETQNQNGSQNQNNAGVPTKPQKGGEISGQAAQTTVNLVVTEGEDSGN